MERVDNSSSSLLAHSSSRSTTYSGTYVWLARPQHGMEAEINGSLAVPKRRSSRYPEVLDTLSCRRPQSSAHTVVASISPIRTRVKNIFSGCDDTVTTSLSLSIFQTLIQTTRSPCNQATADHSRVRLHAIIIDAQTPGGSPALSASSPPRLPPARLSPRQITAQSIRHTFPTGSIDFATMRNGRAEFTRIRLASLVGAADEPEGIHRLHEFLPQDESRHTGHPKLR